MIQYGKSPNICPKIQNTKHILHNKELCISKIDTFNITYSKIKNILLQEEALHFLFLRKYWNLNLTITYIYVSFYYFKKCNKYKPYVNQLKLFWTFIFVVIFQTKHQIIFSPHIHNFITTVKNSTLLLDNKLKYL